MPFPRKINQRYKHAMVLQFQYDVPIGLLTHHFTLKSGRHKRLVFVPYTFFPRWIFHRSSRDFVLDGKSTVVSETFGINSGLAYWIYAQKLKSLNKSLITLRTGLTVNEINRCATTKTNIMLVECLLHHIELCGYNVKLVGLFFNLWSFLPFIDEFIFFKLLNLFGWFLKIKDLCCGNFLSIFFYLIFFLSIFFYLIFLF